MRSDAAIVATVLGRSLVSIACCMIVGLIVFQARVFHPFFWTSQLGVFSVAGSVFFYTLRISRRNAFAVLLVLAVVTFGLLFRHLKPLLLFADIVFFATLGAALTIFFISFYSKTVNYRNLQPLVLATIFALAFSLATLFVGAMDIAFGYPPGYSLFEAMLTNARYEFLVGLGIGLGILLLDNGYVHWAGEMLKRLVGALGQTFREFGERL